MTDSQSSSMNTVPLGGSSELPGGAFVDQTQVDGIYGPFQVSPQSTGGKEDMHNNDDTNRDYHILVEYHTGTGWDAWDEIRDIIGDQISEEYSGPTDSSYLHLLPEYGEMEAEFRFRRLRNTQSYTDLVLKIRDAGIRVKESGYEPIVNAYKKEEKMDTHTCMGIKKDGNPCSRTVAEQNLFCWQHEVTTDTVAEVPQHINPKEGKMNITHFLREHSMLEGFVLRVVTNMPTEAEEEAFELSRLGHRVEKIGDTNQRLLTIDIGDQSMPLLQRAADKGVKFRFMSVPVDCLAEAGGLVDSWMHNANFAWASAENACFIKFDGVEPGYWGLEPLGILVEYHAKLAKRLNEIVRVTRHSYEGDISMEEFVTPEGMEKEYFDGMNIIRRSFAKLMGFDSDRGNGRFTTPIGLIKGDFIVVDDNLISSDLVYHTENLKPALRTDGWTLSTCMAHSPMHELRHDDQSRANFEFFITPDRVYEDLNEMVAAFKESVSEGGDLAEYLEQQSESFDDPIAVDYEKFGTSQRIEEVASNLKSWGIAPASFSNITYTRLGAIVRKMESTRIMVSGQKTKFFKKMAIPAGNAFLGAITTYEACNLMGGVNFRHHDGTETFFDSRFGLIMPASRFLTTYELHGGWDLDDTVGLFLIKVYCTDQERLAELVASGVLDPAIDVPGEKSEAIEVGLMIRRPNGPGEYSIERIDPDMPWMHYNAERVEVVDLAGAPDGIDAVYSRTNIVPFERTTEIPVAYTRRVAHEAVQAQIINPTVGGFANLLIAWTKTFGVGNLPDTMIGKMEDIVDAVQQSADVLAFSAIASEVRRLWEEFAQKVIETSTPVDSAVWMTRIPKSLGFRPQVKIGLAIHEAGLVEPGDWTRIQNRYNNAIDFCRKLSMDTANITRNNLPLAQRIKEEKFGPAYKDAAANTVKNTAIAFKKLDAEFRALEATAGDNVIMRRAFQTQRRLATEKLVDRMTQDIMGLESLDTHRFMLALYKYMTTPRKGWPNGDIDRLFVQPCSDGGVCLMELFLKALEDTKILEDIQS